MGSRACAWRCWARTRAACHRGRATACSSGQHALVECAPETGRQHQIRVHLDALGLPIVGDKLYPDAQIFVHYQDHGWEAVEDRVPIRRHALHASWIRFPHPVSGELVEVGSRLPDDLAALLRGYRAG